MRKVEEKIYKFDELKEDVKLKIINQLIELIIDTTDFEKLHKNSNLYKAYKKSEDLKTPWFLGEFIFDMCKPYVLKKCRQYEYYENGIVY